MSFKETIKGWAPKELDFQKVVSYETMRDGSARSNGTYSSSTEFTNKVNENIRSLNERVESEFFSSEENNNDVKELDRLYSEYESLKNKLLGKYKELRFSDSINSEYKNLLKWTCLTNKSLTNTVSGILSSKREYTFEEMKECFVEIFDGKERILNANFENRFAYYKRNKKSSLSLCSVRKNSGRIGLNLPNINMGDSRDIVILTIENMDNDKVTFNRKLQEVSYVSGKVFSTSNHTFSIDTKTIEMIIDNEYTPGESNLYVPGSHGGPSPYGLETAVYQAQTDMENNIHNLPNGMTLEKFLED